MKTFKPFTLIAAIVSLMLLCSVVSWHAEKTTGKEVNPIVLVGAIGIGCVAVNFSRIKKSVGGAAFGVMGVNLVDMGQLQLKEFIKATIMLHYGYIQLPDGSWKVGPEARKIPDFADAARIIRNDLFQIQYLTPTESVFEFFNKAQDPAKEFFSNVIEAVPNKEELNIFIGITAELATGAAAADTPDILAFGAPAAGDEEALNGIISYEINNRKELVKQPWKTLFINDEAIKNFMRFPKAIVWEPGNSQLLTNKLSKAYAAGVHKFAKFGLIGFKLVR